MKRFRSICGRPRAFRSAIRWAIRLFVLAAVFWGLAPAARAVTTIAWGERIDLTPANGNGRYPRLLKIRTGVHAGDLLLFYQTQDTGGDFYQYRSTDNGHTWGAAKKIASTTAQWNYASCNVIQLDDGRLLMTHQRRNRTGTFSKDRYIDVRWSLDGGDTWSSGTPIFQGDNWEGRPIQVPHDRNGDGHNDIYVFYTQEVIPTNIDVNLADRSYTRGRAVAWVASYDNGVTWTDPNPERFTGRIVHRDYTSNLINPPANISQGGMPTPFILPNNRFALVSESISCPNSPYLVTTSPNDWDWTNAGFSGPWTSADYDGTTDTNVYPLGATNEWLVDTVEFGGGPYGVVLPRGAIAVSVNSSTKINVWVGDINGKNFQEQAQPFGSDLSFYSFIEPISDTEVLVGAGPPTGVTNDFIYLRRGTIQSGAPSFATNSLAAAGAAQGVPYQGTLAGLATDPDGDPMSFSRGSGPAWLNVATNGALSGTPQSTDLGTNTWTVQVTDGKDGANTATLSINITNLNGAPVQAVLLTLGGTEDGYITESSQDSKVGGTVSPTNNVARIGDSGSNQQFKSIFSFDTSFLPDNAAITSATFRMCRGGSAGTNPYDTHGPAYIDLKTGGFNGNNDLEPADFQAAADAVQAGILSRSAAAGDWSAATLSSAGLNAINRHGRTQVRCYFSLGNNGDAAPDFQAYYTGEETNDTNCAQLLVTYQLVSTNPPPLNGGQTGTNLVLAWPATHKGWVLESQTNQLGIGLSTNWGEVVGSRTNTTLQFPLNPAAPAAFYRLRFP